MRKEKSKVKKKLFFIRPDEIASNVEKPKISM